MSSVGAAVRRYPVVATTLLVGLLGGVLEVAGVGPAARGLLSGYALLVAVDQARGMVADLRRGAWGVDVLAVTAIVATVVVGEYWAALIVCLMLSGGEALEDHAAGRARRELTALLSRAPELAHVVDGGTVRDVPVEEVGVGAELLVRPGEVVPVDAVLLSDSATLDESQLTGEPLPVERGAGEELLSGSVNGARAVHARARATAADSQYQRIIALVREAAESKAPMVRLADRVAVPFTLLAFALAGAAWALSGDPVRFAEVLVVATPCPLLIAAPVAFLAGMSRGARNGIIVKDGGTLERLSRVRTVAFDKTGTLTHGHPEVAAVLPAGDLPARELLRLAAAVETASPHALAAAVVAHAGGLRLPAVRDAEERPGHGVEGTVEGRRVRVGKAGWVTAGAAPAPAPGQIAVHVAADGDYLGAIMLADQVRAEAAGTVSQLAGLGVERVVMVTGDGEATARHVARAVGIPEVHASCLPQDKVRVVADQPRRLVMVVGDGVNDAPVLAAADVGVAMGARGSTAASESADVVVLQDDVHRAARAVAVGRRTTRVAMQAIGIGVGLSVVLMGGAAFGYIPAVVGALLQEVVDLACILWALLAARPGREETHLVRPVGVAAPERTYAPRSALRG